MFCKGVCPMFGHMEGRNEAGVQLTSLKYLISGEVPVFSVPFLRLMPDPIS